MFQVSADLFALLLFPTLGLTGTFRAQSLLRMCQAMSATVPTKIFNHFLDISVFSSISVFQVHVVTEMYDLWNCHVSFIDLHGDKCKLAIVTLLACC